eukprot:366097-Chlamydomonas_euryale.AAC.17
MHQRDGAVGHGVQLVEPARLKPAGHEQQVDARGDPVRHLHAEADVALALLRVARLHFSQRLFQLTGAAAQEE